MPSGADMTARELRIACEALLARAEASFGRARELRQQLEADRVERPKLTLIKGGRGE